MQIYKQCISKGIVYSRLVLSVTDISLAFPDSPHPILKHLLVAVECLNLIQRDSLPAEWHTWWADSRINICCSFRYFNVSSPTVRFMLRQMA